MFQFPSNGKAHGKNAITLLPNTTDMTCFNSLQTGKHMERLAGAFGWVIEKMFQFPSNGKAHGKNRRVASQGVEWIRVSIPFKRESTSKVISHQNISICISSVSIPFKRESTLKVKGKFCTISARKVSIPFKRESTWKGFGVLSAAARPRGVSIPFKRESTWKVRPFNNEPNKERSVSIPFKRESTWKGRSSG